MSMHIIPDDGSRRQVPALSRRAAILAAGQAALLAGLLGTIDPPPAGAAVTVAPFAPSDAAAWSAEARRLDAHVGATLDALRDALAALTASLSPEQRELYRAVDEAMTDHYGAAWDATLVDLCRHLPAFAPTIWGLWRHIIDTAGLAGECCRPGPDGAL